MEGLFAFGDCENAAVELPENAVPGLAYYYYEGEWSALPDFDKEEVLGMGMTSSFNLRDADHYAMVFNGYFYVAEAGDYTFYTSSDDGSALYIDGNRIVNNDGNHGNVSKSGNTCLAAGWHQVDVHYFENSGGQSLSVQWEGAGFSRQNIAGYYTKPISAPVRENQSITFDRLKKYQGEDDFDAATASSGLPIIYYSYNSEVATVVDGKIHLVGEGEAKIRALQIGNLFYNASVEYGTITVSPKESQTITINDMTKYVGDKDFDPAIASSGLPVTYSSYKQTVATIVDGNIHIEEPGTAYIKVTEEGNYQYLPATIDVFILTVEEQTAIEDALANKITIYPNPVKDVLCISTKDLVGAELEVINLMGESIITKTLELETTTLKVQSLNKGVYIIRISIGDKTINYKLVKD